MASGDPRTNLIVIFGGQSAEHDVSCTSAAHVIRAADPARYRVIPIGIGRDGRWSLASSVTDALEAGPDALPPRLDPSGPVVEPSLAITPPDGATTVVFPLLHGPMGEDGTMQGLLELAGLPYVGPGVLSSAVAMDKSMAKLVAAQHGIPQARYVSLRAHEITPGTPQALADELGLPVFVKPANMGSSIGISKARTVEQVRDALHLAARYDEYLIVEEAVVGREIEVAVLGNLEPRASLPGEVVPGADFYDYDDKYVDDGSRTLIPAPLTEAQTAEVRALAVRAYRAMRCDGMARVDFFLEEGTPDSPGRGLLLNEVNTIPGFTPISMYPKMWIATGLSYPALIDELVALALERHTRRHPTDLGA